MKCNRHKMSFDSTYTCTANLQCDQKKKEKNLCIFCLVPVAKHSHIHFLFMANCLLEIKILAICIGGSLLFA